VVNDSHVSEVFDFQLDWTPDDNRATGQPSGSSADEAQRNPVPGTASPTTATDPAGAVSLFTALQEQLGLKLEPRKLPVEILVIDHVERPSEN
jgi:bla regulator protein blaR1